MSGFKAFILIMQGASGLVMIGLAIPLIRRAIPPNIWYGFRVRRTLEDPAVWYEANAYCGRCLLRAGIAIIAGSAVVALNPRLDDPTYAISCTLITLIALAVSVIFSFRQLGRIAKPTDR